MSIDKQYVDHNYDYNKKDNGKSKKPMEMGEFLAQLDEQKREIEQLKK